MEIKTKKKLIFWIFVILSMWGCLHHSANEFEKCMIQCEKDGIDEHSCLTVFCDR